MNLRSLRRAAHVSGGAMAGVLACSVIAAGGLGPRALLSPTPSSLFLMVSITALAIAVVVRRLRFEAPSARSQRGSFWLAVAPAMADMEIAFALVAACYTVIAVSGGASSPMYPLLYGMIAFAVTFQSTAGATAAVGAACILELAFFLRQPFGMPAVVPLLLHLCFLGGAAAAHALFLRGLIARHSRIRHTQLAQELRRSRESARDYRLISASLGPESRALRSREEQEHMLAAAGVDTIQASVLYTLALLRRTMPAETAVLLWMNERGDALKVKEVDSDSDVLGGAERVPLAGVLGAIVRDRGPLLVPRCKPGQVAYLDRQFIGAFAGMPVMEGPHLRGIVCASRKEPFSERELVLLSGASEQILRCVQSEQVLLAVERAKYEHERFYQASAMLCKALTLQEVMETAFAAAAQIVDYDIAAISLYDRERKRHVVESVRIAPGAEGTVSASDLLGLSFRDNTGLVSMVVKNKHYLPAAGELRGLSVPVYTREARLRGVESLVVLPLLFGDEALGTFMLASRRPRHFGKYVRDMLGVIASQVAVSLQNGLMYQKMETMATTDGLTGLTNHRTFQERFAQLLDRAERHNTEAAILLCDVDHFKKVNDTYGHPVGDEVLRQVARVLRSATRKIDIPARYGGEEFAVVLEQTGLNGALQLAERIRNDVGALVIDSDKGPFQVTMSIGISTFPHDARDRAMLIERADHALYHAKRSGRNRCVSYQRFLLEEQTRKAS